MRKVYTVSYGPTFWECRIAITEGKETGEHIVQMVEFWSEWANRLLKNNGDYVKTFLQQLAREIHCLKAENPHISLESLKTFFDNAEGWAPMDGSTGFEILEADDFETHHYEYEVLEEPQK